MKLRCIGLCQLMWCLTALVSSSIVAAEWLPEQRLFASPRGLSAGPAKAPPPIVSRQDNGRRLVYFNGLLGSGSKLGIWINDREFTSQVSIHGVQALHWDALIGGILVTLTGGEIKTLLPGEALVEFSHGVRKVAPQQ